MHLQPWKCKHAEQGEDMKRLRTKTKEYIVQVKSMICAVIFFNRRDKLTDGKKEEEAANGINLSNQEMRVPQAFVTRKKTENVKCSVNTLTSPHQADSSWCLYSQGVQPIFSLSPILLLVRARMKHTNTQMKQPATHRSFQQTKQLHSLICRELAAKHRQQRRSGCQRTEKNEDTTLHVMY